MNMKRIPVTDYLVLMPDGSGSRGDEAMLRGVLHMIGTVSLTLLNIDCHRPYDGKIPDLTGRYYEVYLSECTSELFSKNQQLLVIGADVIDGTYGTDDSLLRLRIVENALWAGVCVHIFCSFRSNVDEKIVNKISSLGQNKIYWHMRDPISLQNFAQQTGIDADFFPDLAFLCSPQKTNYAAAVTECLSRQRQNGRVLVGLNFSQPSFDSLYDENTSENQCMYVKNAIQCIQKAVPNAYFVLISHDSRQWAGHLSDAAFSVTAAGYIGEKQCLILHEETGYPEELYIIQHLDFVVSGRMHLAIAAFSSGSVPIVYTGVSAKYSMSEKVEGIFQSRIGRTDLAAYSLTELDAALPIVHTQKTKLQQCLHEYRMNNKICETEELERLRKEFDQSRKEMQQPGLRKEPERSGLLMEYTGKADSGRIYKEDFKGEPEKVSEKTILKETILKETLLEKASLEETLNEKEQISALSRGYTKSITIIEHLTRECIQIEKEKRELIRERDRKTLQLQDLSRRIRPVQKELEILKASRLFKVMTAVWGIESFLLPEGSGRRSFASACCSGPVHIAQAVKDMIKKPSGKCRFQNRPHNRVSKKQKQGCSNAGQSKKTADESGHGIEDYDRIVFEYQIDPAVSIVIPVYNQFAYTYHCMKAVRQNTDGITYEIILADDCSTDITHEIEQIVSGITVVRTEKNERFLRNCNNAARCARGQYILFLNNDTEVQKGWLKALFTLMEGSGDIGLAGSRLIYADGSLQEAGGIVWQDASAWNYGRGQEADRPEYNYVKDVDYVSGASMMIRKSLWQEIGGFDERFAPAYYEDADLAFEVRKHGYRVVYQPTSVVKHFEGISNGVSLSAGLKKNQVKNKLNMQQKWKEELESHSPNGQDVFHARDRSRGKKFILFLTPCVPEHDQETDAYHIYLYMKALLQKGFCIKLIADNFCGRNSDVSFIRQMGIEVLDGSRERVLEWLKEHGCMFDYVFFVGQEAAGRYMEYFYYRTEAKLFYYRVDVKLCKNGAQYGLARLDLEEEEDEEKTLKMADLIYCCAKDEAEFLRGVYSCAEIQIFSLNNIVI